MTKSSIENNTVNNLELEMREKEKVLNVTISSPGSGSSSTLCFCRDFEWNEITSTMASGLSSKSTQVILLLAKRICHSLGKPFKSISLLKFERFHIP